MKESAGRNRIQAPSRHSELDTLAEWATITVHMRRKQQQLISKMGTKPARSEEKHGIFCEKEVPETEE